MAKKQTKRKATRDRVKNRGLEKKYFSKIKQEYHDIDYIDKLSDKEKEWLSSFMEEDLGARFNHPDKKIYKKKTQKRGSYSRNNARNRDGYAVARATGKLVYSDNPYHLVYEDETYDDLEDNIIENIDDKDDDTLE